MAKKANGHDFTCCVVKFPSGYWLVKTFFDEPRRVAQLEWATVFISMTDAVRWMAAHGFARYDIWSADGEMWLGAVGHKELQEGAKDEA